VNDQFLSQPKSPNYLRKGELVNIVYYEMCKLGKPRLNDLNPAVLPDCVPLAESFFDRDTLQVARELLGCQLKRFDAATSQWLSFRIVETEAYTADDPACHAYKRTTGRAKMLYEHPGTAYVYLIYGMYNCLNVITEAHGVAGAVLFRALEPLIRLEDGRWGAPSRPDSPWRTHGPGRLTQALNITRDAYNGLPLTTTEHGLYLAAGEAIPDAGVIQTTRIGITKAVDYPWRFYVKGSPWVSVK
jgi:DNA-3-methyladenine glycosylase